MNKLRSVTMRELFRSCYRTQSKEVRRYFHKECLEVEAYYRRCGILE